MTSHLNQSKAQTTPKSQPYSSTPKKVLFDHLPKCGGSSLGAYLATNYSPERTFTIKGSGPFGSIEEFKSFPLSKRFGYNFIKGHYANQVFDYTDPACLKITMFRDPIDRAISFYYYAKRATGHYLHALIHESAMSLEDYITSDISDETRNWYTSYFSGLTIKAAEKSPEKSIKRAMQAIRKYDIIGFLDDFSSFTELLHRQANLKHKYQHQKLNVTEGRVKTSEVKPSTIDIIKNVNHLDVELYKRVKNSLG